MAPVTMHQLLETGVHFGHQTKRWNPKMKPFIFGERNGIYIVDLRKTMAMFRDACDFVRNVCSDGASVLFVGTKKQAQQAIREESMRAGMYCVTHRWLGGMLTNYVTIRKSVDRWERLEAMKAANGYDDLTKKEAQRIEKERMKLERNLKGIRSMQDLPGAVFVVDTKKEYIAVREARKLKIPVIAIVDTNSDPTEIDFPIPGNDDAIRAIQLITSEVANMAIEGREIYKNRVHQAHEVERAAAAAAAKAEEKARIAAQKAAEEDAKKAAAREAAKKAEREAAEAAAGEAADAVDETAPDASAEPKKPAPGKKTKEKTDTATDTTADAPAAADDGGERAE